MEFGESVRGKKDLKVMIPKPRCLTWNENRKKEYAVIAEHTNRPVPLGFSISQTKLGKNEIAVSVMHVLNRISFENRRLHLMIKEETHLQAQMLTNVSS